MHLVWFPRDYRAVVHEENWANCPFKRKLYIVMVWPYYCRMHQPSKQPISGHYPQVLEFMTIYNFVFLFYSIQKFHEDNKPGGKYFLTKMNQRKPKLVIFLILEFNIFHILNYPSFVVPTQIIRFTRAKITQKSYLQAPVPLSVASETSFGWHFAGGPIVF